MLQVPVQHFSLKVTCQKAINFSSIHSSFKIKLCTQYSDSDILTVEPQSKDHPKSQHLRRAETFGEGFNSSDYMDSPC